MEADLVQQYCLPEVLRLTQAQDGAGVVGKISTAVINYLRNMFDRYRAELGFINRLSESILLVLSLLIRSYL